MITVTITKKNNWKHIINREYENTYNQAESKYELKLAKDEIYSIVDEYESFLNSDGLELDDQDEINDIKAVVNLQEGFYDFNCGDYSYFISIEKNK